MVIFRYLLKEIVVALLVLTTIIFIIFLSNQFVHYLNRAVGGNMPGMIVLQLMMIEIPNLLGLLLPLGLYMAILLAYGRMYADSEMIALQACGYSEGRLMRQTLAIALVVAVIVGTLVFYYNPRISSSRARLIRSQGITTMIKTIMPQRFHALSGGKRVIYVEEMKKGNTLASHIFYAEKGKKNWGVLSAESAHTLEDKETKETTLYLGKGHYYQGVPGQADFRVSSFDKMKVNLPKPVINISNDARTLPTASLWPLNNKDKKKVAELNWRLSIPVMVFVLTLLALPLSKVNPRQGKFSRLAPAIILFAVYANMMFIGRDWLREGVIPWWMGLWWLHLIGLMTAFSLMYFSRKR
jgi:lipopolysaccharide export system permease protein